MTKLRSHVLKISIFICSMLFFFSAKAQNNFEEAVLIPVNLDEVKREIGYPIHARDAGIEGAVLTSVEIGEDYSYKSHKILFSPHDILTKAVENHIQKLRFEINEGLEFDTLTFSLIIPFNFVLLDEDQMHELDFSSGMRQLSENKEKDALKSFRKSIKKKNFTPGYLMLAYLNLKRQKYEFAADNLKKCLKSWDKYMVEMKARGFVFEGKEIRNLVWAIGYFEEVIDSQTNPEILKLIQELKTKL